MSNKYKNLKILAEKLPLSVFEQKFSESKLGKDLIKLGIVDANGEPIEHEKRYTSTSTRLQKVNHYKKLKAYYDQYRKDLFLKKYLEWLEPHQNKMKKKYPELVVKKEEVKKEAKIVGINKNNEYEI